VKTIHLKAPFFKLIKNGKSNYCVQSTPTANPGESIVIADARQQVTRRVKSVFFYSIDTVPWYVLDSYDMRSRKQFQALFSNLLHHPNLEFIYVLELN
jgi:hypothetical protein